MLDAVDALARDHAEALVSGPGHRPVRPDAWRRAAGQGRHGAAARDPVERCPLRRRVRRTGERRSRRCAITGNIAMPGFTAPKLLWVRKHEPAVFAQVAHRAAAEGLHPLPPDRRNDRGDVGRLRHAVARCRRARLVGRRAGRHRSVAPGDAAPGRRQCARPAAGPTLAPAGAWRTARCWQAARGTTPPARSGLSAIRPGDAFVSLGTSGVLFATTDRLRPWPQAAVHAFCHALPDTWHQMGVTLSAAASLSWWAGVTGRTEADLLAEVGERRTPPGPRCSCPTSAASGPRITTPPSAVPSPACPMTPIGGLLTQAVLEGVAFSLRDCLDALTASGTRSRPRTSSAAAPARAPGSRSSPRRWASRCIVWPTAKPARRSARRGWRGWRSPGSRRKRFALRPPARKPAARSGPVRRLCAANRALPRAEHKYRQGGTRGLNDDTRPHQLAAAGTGSAARPGCHAAGFSHLPLRRLRGLGAISADLAIDRAARDAKPPGGRGQIAVLVMHSAQNGVTFRVIQAAGCGLRLH